MKRADTAAAAAAVTPRMSVPPKINNNDNDKQLTFALWTCVCVCGREKKRGKQPKKRLYGKVLSLWSEVKGSRRWVVSLNDWTKLKYKQKAERLWERERQKKFRTWKRKKKEELGKRWDHCRWDLAFPLLLFTKPPSIRRSLPRKTINTQTESG